MPMFDDRMDLEWRIYNLSTEIEDLTKLADQLALGDLKLLEKCANQLKSILAA